MARAAVPCSVPGCKGRIERGKHPDGSTRDWCPVCERRLLQLRDLQSKLAAQPESAPVAPGAAVREPTDAELLQLVRDRLVMGRAASQVAGRSLNLILDAEKRGQIPVAAIGRYKLYGRLTLQAWGKAYQRKPIILPQTRAYIAALPREESKAITLHELAGRTKRKLSAAQMWAAQNVERPQLRRRATLDGKGRPQLLLWWQEGARD